MKTTIAYKMYRALQKGLGRMDAQALEKVSQYVLSQQVDGISFADKTGTSDLYYTAFGWSLLYAMHLPLNQKAATAYLNTFDPDKLDLVHLAAYTKCKRLLDLIVVEKTPILFPIQRLKSMMAGYDNVSASQHLCGTPYELFLTCSLLEDAGGKMPPRSAWMQALQPYRLEDHGYSNIQNGSFFSTNATASALMLLGQLHGYKLNNQVVALRDKQNDSGGFYANDEAFMPDLLSTATALFALGCYRCDTTYAAQDFISAHWNEQSGGFSATILDDATDIEYTFYGILALGMS